MNGLEVSGVGASYGNRTVLADVHLELGAGEMHAVLGPSGCGKTTLLRSIAGLHRIDRGTIAVRGRMVAQAPGTHVAPEHRGVGLMPQEGALFPHLDVENNVGFGLVKSLQHRRFGDAKKRRARVVEMLELVGMRDASHARPGELSGGQQQRIALARALAPEPAVVLMDEPFAALDAGLRVGIRSEIREMLHANATPAILVTHDRVEALTISDRITVLLNGRTAQSGAPEDVYRRPASREVGAFVGDAVLVDATCVGNTAATLFGTVTVTGVGSGPGSVLIRPEQMHLKFDEDGEFSVLRTAFAGSETHVTLTHRHSKSTVTASVRDSTPVRTGDTVDVQIGGTVPFFAGSVQSRADSIRPPSAASVTAAS